MKTIKGTDQTKTPTTTMIDGKPVQLDVDLMRFAHHLDHSDLSEDQKQEYLGIFWNLVMAFVDLGYGINAAQMACGNLTKSFEKEGGSQPDSLHLEHTKSEAEEGARP